MTLPSLLLVTLTACTSEPADTGDTAPDLATCPSWDRAAFVADAEDEALDEISGAVFGRRHPGVLWVHEDSGADALVFGLDETGQTVATVRLTDTVGFDWEDISAGSVNGEPGLWIGDIGDNSAVRATITLHGIAEPDALGSSSATPISLTMTYEDGARDAEAMWIDPLDDQLWILTKRDQPQRLYTAKLEDGAVLELVSTLAFGTEPLEGGAPTAADVSIDGDLLVVRTYTHAWSWRRAPSDSWDVALAEPPCEVRAADEPQGEAIALAGDGAVWTVSEIDPALYWSARDEP